MYKINYYFRGIADSDEGNMQIINKVMNDLFFGEVGKYSVGNSIVSTSGNTESMNVQTNNPQNGALQIATPEVTKTMSALYTALLPILEDTRIEKVYAESSNNLDSKDVNSENSVLGIGSPEVTNTMSSDLNAILPIVNVPKMSDSFEIDLVQDEPCSSKICNDENTDSDEYQEEQTESLDFKHEDGNNFASKNIIGQGNCRCLSH